MPPPLRIRAVNTAADSENRIHDDRIAAEYGFKGGLVPGVTIYGYMASAVVQYLGVRWLETGAMDVRFFQPFYEGEEVAVAVVAEQDILKVQAGLGVSCSASGSAWISAEPIPDDYPAEKALGPRVQASREAILAGATLGTLEKTLDLSVPGMSAPLDAYIGPERLAHPAILLALANEILVRNYILGPWIHSSSEVRNARAARDGEHVQVRGKIESVYERKGHEFAVLDVAILSAGRLVSRIRHTAIWQPRKLD